MVKHFGVNYRRTYIVEDLESEYTKNYSDIPNEDFNKIIRLDVDSYPNQDNTKSPFKVGQLAGGNGLLIKTYRKGDTSWLRDSKKCDDILNATSIFYKNRKSMPIKNPSQFESIEQFLDMVLNGTEVKAVETPRESEEEKSLNKIEKLRLSQFPSIPSEKFLNLIEADDESDVKKGIVSNNIKTFLAPFYIKMSKSGNVNLIEEEKFLNENKLKIKKLIYVLDSMKEEERKELINSTDSLIELCSIILTAYIQGNSYYIQNLKSVCTEGIDYDYLASTAEYDLVISKSEKACNLADRPQLLYDGSIPFDDWVLLTTDYGNKPGHKRLTINSWCTGWYPEGYGSNYFKSYGGIYINIIWRKYSENPNGMSHQIALSKDGSLREVCSGRNYMEQGYSNAWTDAEGEISRGDITTTDDLEKIAARKSNSFSDLIRIFKTNRELVSALKKYSNSLPRLHNNILFNFLFEREGYLERSHVNLETTNNIFEQYTYDLNTIEEAKKNKDFVLELIIPEGITSIPQGEFEKWTNLISIKFPKSLKKIGARAFANCISLKKLNLNEGLQVISMGAFSGCSNLSGSIALPFSIEKIEPFAFEGHNKKGLSFTLPTAFFNPELNKKLYVPTEPEGEKNWWFQKGRFKERM